MHPFGGFLVSIAIFSDSRHIDMFHASTLDKMSQEDRNHFCRSLPAGRLVDPSEIAELTHFLCSPAGKVMRGAVIDASLGIGSYPGVIKVRHSTG